MTDSRRKGAVAEREFIRTHLLAHWPEASRNLDQYDTDKRDIVRVRGIHWQIKRVERFNVWAALHQADTERSPVDVAVVAFRRNQSRWYCALAADDFVPMFAVALKATGDAR